MRHQLEIIAELNLGSSGLKFYLFIKGITSFSVTSTNPKVIPKVNFSDPTNILRSYGNEGKNRSLEVIVTTTVSHIIQERIIY